MSEHAYVYFFAHKTLPLVKIGKAVCWQTRGADVGKGGIINEAKSLIKKVDNEQAAFDLEFMLHKMFEDKRSPLNDMRDGYTEWFCSSVMDTVKLLVRGLEDLKGLTIKKKPATKGWTGERIDLKADTTSLISLVKKHCTVRVKQDTIYMQTVTDGFQYVMHSIVETLLKRLRGVNALLPAFYYFPDMEWELQLKDSESVVELLK